MKRKLLPARRRPRLNVVSDIVHPAKLSTTAGVAPVVDNIIPEISLDQTREPWIATLVLRDKIVMPPLRSLADNYAQPVIREIQPLAQDAPLHRNEVGQFIHRENLR